MNENDLPPSVTWDNVAEPLQDCLILLDQVEKLSDQELRNAILNMIHTKLHASTEKVAKMLIVRRP